MNKTFRIVWSAIRGAFIVAHEKASTHGKPSSTRLGAATALMASLLAGSGLVLAAPPVNTLPTGGQIVGGATAGTIATNGNAMTINQVQQRIVANWDSYSIGQNASVHYQQPTGGVALNRVTGTAPSEIYGKLTATGDVYLINPNGVMFGRTAQVDVGALVASTANISDADFLAGKAKFARNGSTGKIENEGQLTAALGGYIALLAPEVRNSGVILAQMGTVVLAAGEAVELQFDSGRLANVRVDPSTIATLIDNKNAVVAPGGLIILSAQAASKLQGAAIKNSGTLDASSLTMKGGRIVLEASSAIENTGTITAAGNANHAGGQVEITAPQVVQNGTLDVSGSTGGGVSIKASDSLIMNGQILAKGLAGQGGDVRLLQAQTLTLQPGSRIDVSGNTQGGSVYAESANAIKVEGSIDASSANGSGGNIELAAGTEVALINANLDASGATQGGMIRVSARTTTHTSLADPNNPINDPTAPPQDRPHVAVTGASALRSSSRSGRGGKVELTGDDLLLGTGSSIDATGATGGGEVLVGGDWQGSNGVYQASTVNLEKGAKIEASATLNGDGGKVVLWSDVSNPLSITTVNGAIRAQGGPQGGNGGYIETSAAQVSIGSAALFDTRAPLGQTGLWLLDPYNYTIDATAAANIVSGLNTSNVSVSTASSTPSYGATGGGNGDINVSAAITSGSANSLSLTAANTVYVNQPISVGALSLTGGNSTVGIQMASNISTIGAQSYTGSVQLNGNIALSSQSGGVSFSSTVNALAAAQLFTSSGSWTIPTGITSIDVYAIGGGGGGGGSATYANWGSPYAFFNPTGGGGGAAGYVSYVSAKAVTSGSTISFLVGGGGSAGAGGSLGSDGTNGGNGGTTTVSYGGNQFLAANGGNGGGAATAVAGGGPGTGGTGYGSGGNGSVDPLHNGNCYNTFTCSSIGGGGGGINGGTGSTPSGGSSSNVGGLQTALSLLGYGLGSGGYGYGASATAFGAGGAGGQGTGAGNGYFGGGGGGGSAYFSGGNNVILSGGGGGSGAVVIAYASAASLNINAGSGNVSFAGAVGANAAPTTLSVTTTGNTTFSSGVKSGGNLSVSTGTFNLNGAMNVGANTVSISATGAATESASGTITASMLKLLGPGGNFNFANTANSVSTLAADTGQVIFNNNGTLTIGSVGGTAGITGTGPMSVTTQSGDLTVAADVATSDTSAAAIVLNAGASSSAGTSSGGNVILSGSPNFFTGAGGRVTLFTGSLSGSTGVAGMVGSGSGHFRYNSDESASNYTTALGSGVYAIYRERPSITIGVSNASMIYGDTLPNALVTVTGAQNGDTATQIVNASTAVGGTMSSSGNAIVGSHTVSVSSSAEQLGYLISNSASGTLTVNARPINITTNAGQSKIYGDANPSLAYTLESNSSGRGFVTGDTFSGALARAAGETVGSSYAINQGTLANSNYSISFSGANFAITQRPITLTATSASKIYGDADPTLAFTVTGGSLASVAQTDTLTDVTGTLTRQGGSNVGTYNILLGTGTKASNYAITYNAANSAFTINKRTVTLSASKSYDGSTDLSGFVSFGNLAGSETLTYSGATALSQNVASNATNYVAAITLLDGSNGGLASNYQLPTLNHANALVTINQKTLTVGGSKTYDGSASLLGYLTLSGFVGSETVGYSAATASSSHVATSNKYVSAITLTDGTNGGLAGNYQIPVSYNASTNQLTINAATLTPTISNTGVTKVYDGDTTTTLTPTYTFAGLVSGDTAATLTNTGKAYNSKDVLTADTITVSGLAISGITGSNGSQTSDYVLDNTSKTVAATITAAPITITAVNINDKVYDGTVTAAGVQSTTFTGKRGTDDVNVTGTLGDFSSANVGTYSVSITGTTLTGAQASNYYLTGGTTFTDSSVAITKRTVSLSATKTYDGTAAMSSYLAIDTGVTGETLNFTGSANANSSHVTTASYIASGVTLTDGTGLASNYLLPSLSAAGANNTVSISTQSLTPTLINTGITKVYDGNTSTAITPTYSFSGLVSGDSAATLSYASKSYDSQDVLAASSVTVSGLAITAISGSSGSLPSDYALSTTSVSHAATITPKTLTISGLAASGKVYDATTDVTITNWGNVTTGVGSETLVLNHGTASFSDKNKANGKTVTAIDYALADGGNGGLASNYQLSSTSSTTTANITAKPITLDGNSGVTKTYDGRTIMPVGDSGYGSLVGVVSGDTVTITGAPVYDSANAGSRTVLQGTVGIAGTDAGNYSMTWANGSGTIDKAPLTVSANADAKFVTQADAAGYYGVTYSGFVNGETTSALNIAGLSITRGNSSQNNAGTYSGVLIPAGVTAANYQISYSAGDYTIVPANQLLVRVTNTSTTYGTAASYTIQDARYMDGSNVIHTLAAPTQSGDAFTYSDGVGGTAVFTLGPVSPQTSTAGQLKAGNYSIGASNIAETSNNFSNTLTVVGGLTVNQKALTANASNVTKVYDGNTTMTNVVLGYTGLVNGDVVTISGNGNFSDKNVGTNKIFSVTALTLSSTDADNYYLTGGDSFSGSNGEVTHKLVSLSATKTYDGNTTFGPGIVNIVTGVGSETLSYSGATVNSKDVLAASYIDAITLLDAVDASGGLASNYRVDVSAPNTSNTASVTPKTVTATVTAADKTYNGTTTADLTLGPLVGLVGSETLNLSGVGNFSDSNVGIGKTVLAQLALADATGLASNYAISDVTTTATINPVPNVVPPLPPSVPTTPPSPPSVPDPSPPPSVPDTTGSSGSGSSSGGSSSGTDTSSGSGSSSGGDTSSGSGSGSSSGGSNSGTDTSSGSGSSSGGDTSSGSGSGSSSGGSSSGTDTSSGSGSSSGGDTSSGSGSGSSSGGSSSGTDTSSGSGSSSGGDTSTGSGSGSSSGGSSSGTDTSSSGSSSGGDTSSGSSSGSSSGGSSSGTDTSSGSGSSSGGDTSSGSGSSSSSGGSSSGTDTSSGSGSSSGGDTSSGSGSGSSSGGSSSGSDTSSGSGSSSGGDTSSGSGSGSSSGGSSSGSDTSSGSGSSSGGDTSSGSGSSSSSGGSSSGGDTSTGSGSGSSSGGSSSGTDTSSGSGSSSGGDTSSGSGSGSSSGGSSSGTDTSSGSGSSSGGDTSSGSGSSSSSGGSNSGTDTSSGSGSSSGGDASSGSGSGSSSGSSSSGTDTSSGSGSGSGSDTSSGSGSGSSSGGSSSGTDTSSGSGSSSGGDASSGSGSGSSSGGSSSGTDTSSGSGSSSGGDTSSGSGSGSSSGGSSSGTDTSSGSGSSSGGDTSSGSGSGSSSGGSSSGTDTSSGSGSSSGGDASSGSGSSSGSDTSSGSGSGSSSGGSSSGTDTSSGSGSSSGGDASSGSGSGSSSGGSSSGMDTSSGSGSSSGGDASSGSGSGSSSGSSSSGGTTSGSSSGSSSGTDTSSSSGSGGGKGGSDTGSGAATTNSESNRSERGETGGERITVTLLKQPTEAVTGAVLVEVPGELVRAAGGFSFPLPKDLTDLATSIRSQPVATLVNGDPLPPWLRFESASSMFVAQNVPNGGLPIQVIIKIGNTRTILLVTERNG